MLKTVIDRQWNSAYLTLLNINACYKQLTGALIWIGCRCSWLGGPSWGAWGDGSCGKLTCCKLGACFEYKGGSWVTCNRSFLPPLRPWGRPFRLTWLIKRWLITWFEWLTAAWGACCGTAAATWCSCDWLGWWWIVEWAGRSPVEVETDTDTRGDVCDWAPELIGCNNYLKLTKQTTPVCRKQKGLIWRYIRNNVGKWASSSCGTSSLRSS